MDINKELMKRIESVVVCNKLNSISFIKLTSYDGKLISTW